MPIVLPFIKLIKEVINNPLFRDTYLSNFKRYQQQVIESEFSYLKSKRYYICHYDKTKKFKRKNCSLTMSDLLKIEIKDSLYEKYINIVVNLKDLNFENFIEYHIDTSILFMIRYKYSKELILLKILIDIDKKIGQSFLSSQIFNYIKYEKVTHNLTMQNKIDLKNIIEMAIDTKSQYSLLDCYMPLFEAGLT